MGAESRQHQRRTGSNGYWTRGSLPGICSEVTVLMATQHSECAINHRIVLFKKLNSMGCELHFKKVGISK